MQNLETWQIIALAVAVVVLFAAIALAIASGRRRRHLRDHFGPEYDRAVNETGSRRQAEAELARREERVRKAEIRPLSIMEKQRFQNRWTECQTQFVDDPVGAVNTADDLLTDVLRTRGYSTENAYDRISNISAAYPRHAMRYRMAEGIVTRHHGGDASTEDLRQAFVHYRAIFDEILRGEDEGRKRAS